VRIENIKSKVIEMSSDRFEIKENGDFVNQLIGHAADDVFHKQILRIRRIGIQVDCWKTLALIEIETDVEKDFKAELKRAISWIASIKESLLGNESSDLYLFLAFNNQICKEECLRIEATEQLCRKYVLLPGEDISEFVNRTFLQKYVESTDKLVGNDPLERAFSKTVALHNWLMPEIQEKWKKAFLSLYGSELIDVILEDEVLE
jgi:hypothetical protein